jgi:hypothetical protein
MTPTHTYALAYALRRAAGLCIKCPRRSPDRLCFVCSEVNRQRVKAEKRALKYGREQAREAR